MNFEIFMIILVVLGILAAGNFLRDLESNWLEGPLLVVSLHFFTFSGGRCCRYEWLTGESCETDCLYNHRDCILVLPESGYSDFQRHRGFGRLSGSEPCYY